MPDAERRRLTFQERVPTVVTTMLGVIAAEALAVGGYAAFHHPQVKDQSPDALLRSVAPCASDPISFEVDSKRYVISDSRCRNKKGEEVAIFSAPNEATLGPIALVDIATPIRATCVVEGQEISLPRKGLDSDIWVRVELDSVDGVSFQSDKSTGYVSEFDVIGDSHLPVCGVEDSLTV